MYRDKYKWFTEGKKILQLRNNYRKTIIIGITHILYTYYRCHMKRFAFFFYCAKIIQVFSVHKKSIYYTSC